MQLALHLQLRSRIRGRPRCAKSCAIPELLSSQDIGTASILIDHRPTSVLIASRFAPPRFAMLRPASAALLAFLLAQAGPAASKAPSSHWFSTLSNKEIVATLDAHKGLTSIGDVTARADAAAVPLNISVSGDAWAMQLTPRCTGVSMRLTPDTCTWRSGSVSPQASAATLTWRCPVASPPREEPVFFAVNVTYEVPKGAGFVSKAITVASSRPESGVYGEYLVEHVDVWANVSLQPAGSGSGAGEVLVQDNAFQGALSIAAFVRFPWLGRGAFLSAQNPWVKFLVSEPVGPSGCVPGQNSINDDLPNMPLKNVSNASLCRDLCETTPACKGFTFQAPECEHLPTTACWLKTDVAVRQPEACSCTGAKPFSEGFAESRTTVAVGYDGKMNHTVRSPRPFFEADIGVLGLTSLSKCKPSLHLDYSLHYAAASRLLSRSLNVFYLTCCWPCCILHCWHPRLYTSTRCFPTPVPPPTP